MRLLQCYSSRVPVTRWDAQKWTICVGRLVDGRVLMFRFNVCWACKMSITSSDQCELCVQPIYLHVNQTIARSPYWHLPILNSQAGLCSTQTLVYIRAGIFIWCCGRWEIRGLVVSATKYANVNEVVSLHMFYVWLSAGERRHDGGKWTCLMSQVDLLWASSDRYMVCPWGPQAMTWVSSLHTVL